MIVTVIVHAIRAKTHVTGRPAHRPGPEMFRAECCVELTRGRVVVAVVMCGVVISIVVIIIASSDEFKAALSASNRCTAREGLGGTVMSH